MRPPAMTDLARRWAWVALLLVITRTAVGQLSSPEGVVAWGATSLDSRLAEQAFVDVGAGGGYTLARRADGTIAAWGRNDQDQCRPLPLPVGIEYVDVAAGFWHTLGLCQRRRDFFG